MPTATAAGTFPIAGELEVSRLGFGAMRLTGPGITGPPADREGAIAVLRRAVELGVTHIDTADEAKRIVKGGDHPTRSSLEDDVLDVIEAQGLPTPQINQPLPNGLVPDFRWPDLHLILEADGAAYHDNPLAREDDAKRQAQLEAQGETVLRVRGSRGSGRAPTASPARGSPPTPGA